MSINSVLSDMQRKLQVPKAQYNSFARFHYRSCEDILEAVKKLLPEGVSLTLTDDIVMIGDRIYVKATAYLSDGKDSVYTYAFAREPLEKKGADSAQITGATSSYARKYALAGLFLIDDSKDADSKDNSSNEIMTATDVRVRQESSAKYISEVIEKVIRDKNIPNDSVVKMKTWLAVEKFSDAPEDKLKALLERINQ